MASLVLEGLGYLPEAFFIKEKFTIGFRNEFVVDGWVEVKLLEHPNSSEWVVELPTGKTLTVTTYWLKPTKREWVVRGKAQRM